MTEDLLDKLRTITDGEDASAMRSIYDELHRTATRLMAGERKTHTLQATALVHEFWLKLMPDEVVATSDEEARRKFLAFAARGMRQVLIDHARRQRAAKRGGDRVRETFFEPAVSTKLNADQLLDLEDGIRGLETRSPRLARIAELRLFAGLSPAEAAGVLGVARSTAIDDWALARAMLSTQLGAGQKGEGADAGES